MIPERKHAIALGFLLESVAVNDQFRQAVAAAAEFMKDCNCQKRRRAEALKAVAMANAAIDRMDRLNVAIATLYGDATPRREVM